MNENEERHSITDKKSPYGELTAKLVICGLLVALTILLKSLFPAAAETVSRLLLGDGSYREAFSQLGGGEVGLEAFAAAIVGEEDAAEG